MRVEGTGSILGYGQSQDWTGKRGKGITLFIGIIDGSNTSAKSDLTLFCKIGWMKSGTMLSKGQSIDAIVTLEEHTRSEAVKRTPSPVLVGVELRALRPGCRKFLYSNACQ